MLFIFDLDILYKPIWLLFCLYKLRIGTILEPQLEFYTRRSDVQFLEKIMYAYRPDDKLSRYDSVFLVDNIDDIDSSGGYTDFIYEVSIPDGIIP